MKRARLRIVVTGRVQGVGFRYFTHSRAGELGLTGYVRNLPDGNVEVEAEGEHEKLDTLVEALRQGPGMAHVLELKVTDLPVKGDGQDVFRITY